MSEQAEKLLPHEVDVNLLKLMDVVIFFMWQFEVPMSLKPYCIFFSSTFTTVESIHAKTSAPAV